MSEPEIRRLREDLDVIRQAAGVDLPFNGRDVWLMTAVGCTTGAAIALMGWCVPVRYNWVVVLPAAVMIAVWLGLAQSIRRRRATEPARWREMRYGLLSFFVFVPIVVGFMIWEVILGMPRATVGASALFFLGLGLAWVGVTGRTRRSYIGGGLPLIVFGLSIPFCDPQQVRVGAGLMVIAGGLATAAIQVWQLRSQRRNTDAN